MKSGEGKCGKKVEGKGRVGKEEAEKSCDENGVW